MAGNMLSASKMLRQRLSSKKPRNKKRNYFTNAAEKKKFIKLNFCLRKIGWEGCPTRFGYVDWQYLQISSTALYSSHISTVFNRFFLLQTSDKERIMG